jgi:hypothetical protein
MDKDVVGRETAPFEVHLDEARNEYYLEATSDGQAIYRDRGVALAAGLTGKPAPPTRLFGPASPGFPDPLEFMGTSHDKAVMGGARYTFRRLPLVGETLVCRGKATDLTTKETPRGPMEFLTIEMTYTDAAGDTVAVEELTFIERP